MFPTQITFTVSPDSEEEDTKLTLRVGLVSQGNQYDEKSLGAVTRSLLRLWNIFIKMLSSYKWQ